MARHSSDLKRRQPRPGASASPRMPEGARDADVLGMHEVPPVQRTRVGRSMAAGSPGTVKLRQRYGAHLLLVRYRYDWTGLYRYTTVEILVDATPTTRGRALETRYAVQIKPNEQTLLAAATELGARWDPQLRRWTLPGQAVQTLGLGSRVELAQVLPPRRKVR